MRFTVELAAFKFHKGLMTKTLKHQIRQNILIAAKEFIEEAAPRTPVHTGMARGGFLNLQALLNMTHKKPDVNIPTTIQAFSSTGRYLKYKDNDTGLLINKSPRNARRFSTPRNEILTEVDGAWKFTYENRVTHFNAPSNVRRWRAFQSGRDAMKASLKSLKRTYPRISSFIMSAKIEKGRQSAWKFSGSNADRQVKD